MLLWKKISSQFGKPTGLLGDLAGLIMSKRLSNIQRNDWGISMLELKPTDTVLEIGFGPGVAIQKMSKLIIDGMIYGIDHSDLMVQKASLRNKENILSGKVKLITAPASMLPAFIHSIDKILAINSIQFWEDPIPTLKELKKIMRKNGVIAIIHQPRKPGATEKDSLDAAFKYSEYLKQADFKNVVVKKKMIKPVPVICVLGAK